jgi:hypothetical protein
LELVLPVTYAGSTADTLLLVKGPTGVERLIFPKLQLGPQRLLSAPLRNLGSVQVAYTSCKVETDCATKVCTAGRCVLAKPCLPPRPGSPQPCEGTDQCVDGVCVSCDSNPSTGSSGSAACPCRAEDCGPSPGTPSCRCADGSLGCTTGRCVRDATGCVWEFLRCAP